MPVILLRTVVLYVLILLGMRLMGKRQISQLQTSELVVALLISELAVMPIQNYRESIWNGILPMAVLTACEILVSLLMLRSGRFRQLVCGKPIVVIENGRLLQDSMRKLRMTNEDLFVQLRQNNVFSLEDVAYAVIETNGMMSVLRNSKDDPLTPKDAGVKVKARGLEVVVISDGEISEHSLQVCGKEKSWVLTQLQNRGLLPEDVFLMTVRTDGNYQIVKKEEES